GLGVERAALLGEHDLEGEVEEEVAELAGQGVVILFGDGVRDLVGLFEQVGEQGRRCLRRVPGAVGAQEPDEVERAVEARPAGGGKRRKIGHLGLRRNPWAVYTRHSLSTMSNTWQSRAWVEVDLGAVRENFATIRRALGPGPGII